MSLIPFRTLFTAIVACSGLVAGTGWAQESGTLPQDWANMVTWRSIGPANTSGRITSIAVFPGDSSTYWVASASGGLLKTVNNGNDFEHQFDREATVAVGDVQVAASNRDIVWVGTGEANPRNSVSWGDGVYKSVDGGKTWKNMGLKKSFQIGRIAIHPENPDIVYVGALGRLWGPSEERGLFKTVDGGKTWEKIHYVDDKTGVIDLKMNPKNPEELVFATYERLRDGFDGNDPIKRYGPGSGIWKTSDGGKTVKKLAAGLPSCNMGRIGLDYFAKDPDYVVAIIESEKIASVPENAAYFGVRGEDADAGSRITDVTADSPAAKGELKVDDIVLRVDGEAVLDYQQLLISIRKHVAGEKIRLEVVRDKEIVELSIELSKYPEGNRGANPYTGTLGGQAENLHDQQGTDGHEYGGIYLSKDGGESWTRINSLNPRPMYYSQIRFDPKDRKNLYVCGTSLYKSKDGGKTFTGDGGSDGIHVDHHALWVDPNDPRHMLLGNDGGLHVTWDRMEHWDTHNHFAIGQFYHAGVDTRTDWNVYGGLQDNGSWGGPNRSGRDSGPINSDWFSVGGGDGFLVLVDPDDPDQIYSESQNGGMTRMNLRTGERGSIRPRAQRGTRYRFDWKTPFLLSPHNSQIFYTAGNFVFQSLHKGDNLKAISPEITNTNLGSGSALTESPVESGVLYVGTTDGAIWVTRNSGQSWEAIFSKPEAVTGEAAAEEPESGGEAGAGAATGEGARPEGAGAGRRGAGGGRPGRRPAAAAAEGAGASSEEAKAAVTEEKAAEKTEKKAAEKEEASDVLAGNWQFETEGAQQRGILNGSSLELKLDSESGKVTGKLVARRGEYEIEDGKFEAGSGKLEFKTTTTRGEISFTAELKDGTLSGKAVMGGEIPDVEFRAKRIRDSVAAGTGSLLQLNSNVVLGGMLTIVPAIATDESCNGIWEGAVESDQIPGGRMPFTISLKAADGGKVTGNVESQMGTLDIVDGIFNAENGKLQFTAGSDDVDFEFSATVKGDSMSGTASAAEAEMEVTFNAKREAAAEQAVTAAQEKTAEVVQEKAADPAAEKPAAEAAPAATQEPAKAPESTNPLIGSWKGRMIMQGGFGGGGGRPGGAGGGRGGRQGGGPGGFNDITLVFALNAEGKLTGTMDMAQGEMEMSVITLGETGKVHFVTDNERFELTFDGQVTENKLNGSMDFGGNFQAEFEAEKTGSEQAASASTGAVEARAGGGDAKKLEELVPGPRWVSALTASKFNGGRVYLSLDGHRSDDDEVYMFASEDYGSTWTSIKGNMPTSAGSVRVLREDIEQENILYAGCEFSAWVSVDRGRTWTRFGGLPTVAVHEFAQHPTTGDVVAATHGRSLWVANVTALRQMSAEKINAPAVLYQPAKVIRWRSEARAGDSGTRRFVGENPPNDARIFYSLGADAESIEMTIHAADGRLVQRFDALETAAGLHSVSWNMREQGGGGGGAAGGPGRGPGGGAAGGRGQAGGGAGGRGPGGGAGGRGQAGGGAGGRGPGGGGGGGGGGRFQGGGRQAGPGSYLVTLTANGEVFKTVLTVEADPDLPADATAVSGEEFEMQDNDDQTIDDDGESSEINQEAEFELERIR